MSMKKALIKAEGTEHAPPKLSDLDWWVIEVGLEILRPLMLAQLKLEGEKYVTGSLIIPMISEIRTGLVAAQARLAELAAAVGPQEVEEREDFSVDSMLDSMIQDFEYRWGDGADILCFKYGQHGTGKGQPCGFTNEQIVQFACDPRMIALPEVPEENEEAIWDLTERYLKEMIRKEVDFKPADDSGSKGKEAVGTQGGGGGG